MAKVKIKYSGHTPGYLEGFPKDCKRSCKGAIHLLPGAVKEVEEEEYAYIQKAYSKLPISKLKSAPKKVYKPVAKKDEPKKVSAPKKKVAKKKRNG